MSKFMAYTKLNLKLNLMWLLTLSLSPWFILGQFQGYGLALSQG
jgi:hypothetical protein